MGGIRSTMGDPSLAERSPLDALSGERMENNMRNTNKSRVIIAIVAGMGAGTLGLTGMSGLLFYVFWILAHSVLVMFQCKFKTTEYFLSTSGVFLDGLSQGGMTFMLLWMRSCVLSRVQAQWDSPNEQTILALLHPLDD